MANPIDQRRLSDGARGLAASARPATLAEAQRDYNQMMDGAVALQSTNDLGSPEANQVCWDDMVTLQRRAGDLKAYARETWGVDLVWGW